MLRDLLWGIVLLNDNHLKNVENQYVREDWGLQEVTTF